VNHEVNELLFSGLTITFLKQVGIGLWLGLPLLLSLAAAIAVLGLVAGKKEGWSRFDSVYWSFVTATTVGYGDFRPTHRTSRVIAIMIALLGLTMTGILIAVAVHAATLALAAHDAAASVK
jgi:voltage-gated potassium channel Kch